MAAGEWQFFCVRRIATPLAPPSRTSWPPFRMALFNATLLRALVGPEAPSTPSLAFLHIPKCAGSALFDHAVRAVESAADGRAARLYPPQVCTTFPHPGKGVEGKWRDQARAPGDGARNRSLLCCSGVVRVPPDELDRAGLRGTGMGGDALRGVGAHGVLPLAEYRGGGGDLLVHGRAAPCGSGESRCVRSPRWLRLRGVRAGRVRVLVVAEDVRPRRSVSHPCVAGCSVRRRPSEEGASGLGHGGGQPGT